MEKSILVDVRTIYGRQAIYPLCAAAKTFARIAGTQTLTRDAIEHIKALGYTVAIKPRAATL